ncbi:MAG: type transport system permease protein [Acidimicrobiia bacterium]|jgi:ABC-2 type transport system permease protein|nr:type transport system permease protein [Acidimicrobiia bacterium]
MFAVELRKLLTRPRTWLTVALLAGLPTVIAIFLKATRIGPRPGQGPALLSEVLNNGLLFPAAALGLVLPIFLPVATAVFAGDSIAGEADAGTLRYLLIRPVGRTRLLLAKLVSVTVFVFLAVLIVAGVGYVTGWLLFGVKPVASVSGSSMSYGETLLRTAITILYIGVSMLGVAAIAMFASSRTDSPTGAALTALAAFITSEVLDLVEATRAIDPYLPTHYWLSFIDLYRTPILWHDVLRGFGVQAVYIGVFLGAAWASFSTKDITS